MPVDYLADEPASPNDVLGERYKATNEAHKLIADVYALGMVNDGIFEGNETFKNLAQVKKLKTATRANAFAAHLILPNRTQSPPTTRLVDG